MKMLPSACRQGPRLVNLSRKYSGSANNIGDLSWFILLAESHPNLTISRKIGDATSVRTLFQNFSQAGTHILVLWQFTLHSKPPSKEAQPPLAQRIVENDSQEYVARATISCISNSHY